MQLNRKDEELIGLLRQNGRMPVSEIARKMNVARTTAQMRLQKLEANKVITGYRVNLSEQYQGAQVRALMMIKFPPSQRIGVEKALGDMQMVTSLHSISGAYDLAAVVSAGSMAGLDQIIDRIGCLKGVDETMSSIILSTKFDR